MLSDYYSSVIASFQRATEIDIPSTVHWQNSKHNVPGWNEFVDEKHDLARQAILDLVSAGRPHDNFFLPRMRRTRAAFKHALRYCSTHEEQIRADAYAASLEAHDNKKFWEQVQKNSCKRATLKATSFNGVVGEKCIASMWKTHFERIYFLIDCSYYQQQFQYRMKAAVTKSQDKISMDDIIDALPNLKRNKAPEPDNITAEAFLHNTPRLMAHIGILLSWFLEYGYLPCLLYTSPSPRDGLLSRMPSSA